MSNTSNAISGSEVRATATGVFFMALFGTLWAYTGIIGLNGWGETWLLCVSITIGIILLIGGILLICRS